MISLISALIAAFALSSAHAQSQAGTALSQGGYRCEALFRQSTPTARLAYEVRHQLENAKDLKKLYGRRTFGYVVISSAMVASGALGIALSDELPKQMTFVAGQVSAIGIYMLGAPIWEPISSAFRKFAFGLGDKPAATKGLDQELEKQFERQWMRTQTNYSLNAQMSRNILQAFLNGAHDNFSTAREAMTGNNTALAVDQIAEMAVRLRRIYSDIEPTNESVTLAIQSSFTRHIQQTPEFYDDVMKRILESDPEATSLSSQEYYQALLTAWLQTTRREP